MTKWRRGVGRQARQSGGGGSLFRATFGQVMLSKGYKSGVPILYPYVKPGRIESSHCSLGVVAPSNWLRP